VALGIGHDDDCALPELGHISAQVGCADYGFGTSLDERSWGMEPPAGSEAASRFAVS
jgi:hypothetical protein